MEYIINNTNWFIETDVNLTKDKIYITIHD